MHSSLPQIDDYRQLFLQDIPLMDVRAPVEFHKGAFPMATNLPLMTNDERHNVGIRYKEQGQDKAIELGHELVCGMVKEVRLAHWAGFTQQYPHGALYCFRGGKRSKITQQWIYEHTGIVYPRIKGGYKAMRRYLIDRLDAIAGQLQPVILGGRTGSGKTILLQQLQNKINLEGIFQHRGSAFGRHVTPQPSQIDIENRLAIELLKFDSAGISTIVLEDEAPAIGSRRIPDCLYHTMKQSPLVLLEVDMQERVDNIFQEYILDALAEYQRALGQDEGFDAWANNLLQALNRIERRLGGQRHQALAAIMEDAILQQRKRGEAQNHKTWIHTLLAEYYDPMYDYQIRNKADRIIFRGGKASVLDYLALPRLR